MVTAKLLTEVTKNNLFDLHKMEGHRFWIPPCGDGEAFVLGSWSAIIKKIGHVSGPIIPQQMDEGSSLHRPFA